MCMHKKSFFSGLGGIYDLHPSLPMCVIQDLISVLLPRVLPAITVGLQDLDDDVRAVAASSLIPVVEGLVQLLPSKVREAKQVPLTIELSVSVDSLGSVIFHAVLVFGPNSVVKSCLSGALYSEHTMGCTSRPGRPHCFHQQHHDIAVLTAHLPTSPTVQVCIITESNNNSCCNICIALMVRSQQTQITNIANLNLSFWSLW